MENKKKFLSDKAVEKSRFRELSNNETTEEKKNRKCRTGSDKKAINFGLKLFNGTPKFPSRFTETISLILPNVELIM